MGDVLTDLVIAAIAKLVEVYNRLLKLEIFQVSVANGLLDNYREYGISYRNPDTWEKEYMKLPAQAYIRYPEKELNAEKVFWCLHVLVSLFSRVKDGLGAFCGEILWIFICNVLFSMNYLPPPDSDKILWFTSLFIVLNFWKKIWGHIKLGSWIKYTYIELLVGISYFPILHFLLKYHHHSTYLEFFDFL